MLNIFGLVKSRLSNGFEKRPRSKLADLEE
jgi:hypothetical protein